MSPLPPSPYDEARRAALAARAAGDRAQALAQFRAAHALNPNDRWTRHDIACEFQALGRNAEAEAAYLRVAEGTPLPHALRGLAELARRGNRHEDALALFRAAAHLLPDDAWFGLDVALALDRSGRAEEAEAAFAALTTRHPAFAAVHRARAHAAARRGDLVAAASHMEAALALAPEDADTARSLAETLLKLGRLDAAEDRFVGLLLRRPDFSPALVGLARIARRRNDGELARAHLAAAEKVTREPFARMEIAAEWLALGEAGRARALYAPLSEMPETKIPAILELAALARRDAGPEAARRLLARALAADPAHPRALLMLGDDHRERGALDAADAAYDGALAARPDFAWAQIGKAGVARLRGDRVAARRHLEQAAALDPAEDFATLELASLARDEGHMDAARALLEGIAPNGRRGAQAALALAHLLRAEGRFAHAARAFEAVAGRWPGEVDALVEASEDALRAGENEAAERLLAQARRLAPSSPALLEALARRAVLGDDPQGALALYERAMMEAPGRLHTVLAAARLEMVLGEPEAGLDRFGRAEEQFGMRPDILIARAEMQRQRGLVREAQADLTTGARLFPQHFGLRFARILGAIEAGRHGDAQTLLDAAPGQTCVEEGRLAFARSLLHSARWEFGQAVRHGEAAAVLLPGDGWVRNRLIHAALLDLDLDRAGRHLGELAKLEAGANRLRGKSANPSQSHYGQIFDEFRLDAEALAALAAARDAPETEQPERLARIVRDYPDNTASAITFFIAQRRAGRLAPVPQGEARAIPACIHQYWDGDTPPADLEPLIESWRAAHPGFAHRLWSQTSARAFLESLGDPAIPAAFGRAQEPAMNADIFRLALLNARGGIYADADDRCLASVEPLLAGGHGLVCYQEDLGSLGNNFLAARPGHPVIARALRLAVDAVNRGDNDILWLSTGPGLLTRAAAGAIVEAPALMADMLVLDRPDLSAHVAIHCLAAYKATERHWSRTAFGGRRQAARAA